jgi:hypothetical protein
MIVPASERCKKSLLFTWGAFCIGGTAPKQSSLYMSARLRFSEIPLPRNSVSGIIMIDRHSNEHPLEF